jgi:ectoine hydroxylase-related dioxygenase (phytanoyl-CoA dioxygenase family)
MDYNVVMKTERRIRDSIYGLHTDGFIVHKSIIDVSNDLLDDIKSQAKRCDVIFNHNKKHKKNDKKRSQMALNQQSGVSKEFSDELYEFLNETYPNLMPADTVIIKSLPGCQQQMPHTDYMPTVELRDVPDDYMPLGCIVAVMPSTYLYVWPNSIRLSTKPKEVTDKLKPIKPLKLELQPGDILIFRGDLVHAGSDYDTYNYRIHTYLDSPKINRRYNKTWFATNLKSIQ